MDEKEEVHELKRSWTEHPITRGLQKAAAVSLEDNFERLKSACIHSTDPKVTAAYQRWLSSSQRLAALKDGEHYD